MFTRAGWLMVGSALGLVGFCGWPSPAQRQQKPPEPAASGTRGPSALAFSRDGAFAYVAEQESATVDILDAATGRSLARIASGGKEPSGLAVTPDGGTLLAANSFSGTLGIIDVQRRAMRRVVRLPGGPCAVVAVGGRAFVSLKSMDVVAVVDLASARVIARVSVGRRPGALALAPGGASVLCANMAGGSLSVIDTSTYRETRRIPVGAINLRGVALSRQGALAYVTGQLPHNHLPTDHPETLWSNVLCVVDLAGRGRILRTLPLDSAESGAADPYGVAVQGDRLFVTLGGVHALAAVHAEADAGAAPTLFRVGANPRAIAQRPGGEIWVANYLGNSLSVRAADGAALRTLALDAPPRTTPRLHGQYLFTSAHLTKGGRFTCNTCHPDGNTDGLAWTFAHVHDGLNPRNSRNLRGGLLLTGPYGWSGRTADFEVFVNDEIQHLFGARRLPHGEIHAFWELVNEFDMPPNPYRNPDGSLTAAALRGRALFQGKAACSGCHTGGQYGGAGKKEWIGTSAAGAKLDVPHLVGAYDSAPYLHDAGAPTLESIFTRHNAGHLHGKAHLLTPAQLQDLLEFVREL